MHISKHCKDRFITRGRLLLRAIELERPYETIKWMISQGQPNIQLKNTPFYRNKIGCDMIINGRFKFYIKNNTVVTCVVTKVNEQLEWRK